MQQALRCVARQEAAHLRVLHRQGMAVRELLRARERGWPDAPVVLAPLEDVNRWMSDARTVDPDLGLFDRTQLWMNLRLLHGLDLDEFLHGSRHAYCVVSELMRNCQWDALEPLLQKPCLEAMQELAPKIEQLPKDTNNSVKLTSAVLTNARLLEPCDAEGIVQGTAHLNVRFNALQGVTLHDLQSGAVPLTEPRLQESTWTFEGVVRADDGDEERVDWRVIDIEWQVWEVQQQGQQDFPGWPTHGP